MTATRQFLVTMSAQPDETLPPDRMANRIAGVLLACPSVCVVGMVERTMSVVPLPDLAADDADLQIGFRALSELARNGTYLSSTTITTRQAAALVAELSKQHPARTVHVDQGALAAALDIQRVVKMPNLREVQKTARIQMIVTDAICRCVPEAVA